MSTANSSEQRKGEILSRLSKDTHVAVSELAAAFGCSEMTIRRDLAKLKAEGLVERSHGGAVATRLARLETALSERAKLRGGEKAAIARVAAPLAKAGQRIILDTGTTTLALARELRTAQGICVVTTSLAVASALLSGKGVECMLVGGTVRDGSPDLCGPLMEENLSRLHADCAFIGCDALSASGELMTTDPRVARASELMVRNSERVALLTDSSKAGRSAFVAFARLDQLDWLVTDAGMPEEYLEMARHAGVEVIIADAGGCSQP